jgi:hypothetical protein
MGKMVYSRGEGLALLVQTRCLPSTGEFNEQIEGEIIDSIAGAVGAWCESYMSEKP